jgi:hypothetical protein
MELELVLLLALFSGRQLLFVALDPTQTWCWLWSVFLEARI